MAHGFAQMHSTLSVSALAALTNLDAATYQVCYQLKILTTAVFSMLLLSRKFSLKKWLALILLTIGVSIVQISGSGDPTASAAESHNRFVGLVAVLCAACTSGFSGVYFEKVRRSSYRFARFVFERSLRRA